MCVFETVLPSIPSLSLCAESWCRSGLVITDSSLFFLGGYKRIQKQTRPLPFSKPFSAPIFLCLSHCARFGTFSRPPRSITESTIKYLSSSSLSVRLCRHMEPNLCCKRHQREMSYSTKSVFVIKSVASLPMQVWDGIFFFSVSSALSYACIATTARFLIQHSKSLNNHR